jgi:competence protein ComEC
MHLRCGEVPFLALTASLAVGIALSRTIDLYWFSALSVAGTALLLAAAIAWRQNRNVTAWSVSLCAIALGGFMLGLARRDAFAHDDLRSLTARNEVPLGEMALVDGCVAEDPQQRSEEILTILAMRGFARPSGWIACRGKVLLRMPAPVAAGEFSGLRAGDRLRVWAELTLPRNFQNPGSPDRVETLQRRGVYLLGKVKSTRLLEILPGDCASGWEKFVSAGRDRLRSRLLWLQGQGSRQEAAVLQSILVGDYTGLDSRTREIFQSTGTYHVLVVSGLHVAWIAGILISTFRLVRLPEILGRVLVVSSISFYGCIVGMAASISRCLWMFALYLIGKTLFRNAQPVNVVLAAGFLLLVARPDWLFDAGFQLSFLSVLGICLTAIPLIESIRPAFDPLKSAPEALRFPPGRLPRSGRWVRFQLELFAEAISDRLGERIGHLLMTGFQYFGRLFFAITGMLLISFSVQVWLEPLLACHFNRLSWIAPLANLAAVPVSSAVLAVGMLDALVPQEWTPGLLLTTAAALTAKLLVRITDFAAAIPGAWQRCATPPPALVVLGILILCFCHFLRWKVWLPWILIWPALAFLALNPIQAIALHFGQRDSGSAGKLRITFLDVGEGDSIFVQFPDSRVWIVDAGGIHQVQENNETSVTFDVGEAVVSRFLWHFWITRLDRIVVTHPDLDHAGGVPSLLKNFQVVRVDFGGLEDQHPWIGRDPPFAHRSTAGEREELRGVRIEVLNPPEMAPGRTTNENSIVLRLSFGRFSVLMTGDVEGVGEAAVLSYPGELRSQLLKVSHHGSRFGTSEAFLQRASPRWGVISVGRNNPFGHPSREVVARLQRRGVRYFLTTDEGAISFETDGERYKIESHVGGVLESGVLP